MIKNLRRKFIAITMLSVVIVLALLMGMINYANFRNVNRNLDMRLNLIEENGGTLPAFDLGQGRGPRKDFFADGPDEDEPPAAPPIKPDGNSTPFAPPDGAGEFPGGRDDTPFIRSGLSGESLFDTRFFTVTIDDTGSVSAVNADNIATVTEEQAASIALLLFQKGRTSGYKNEYKFRAVPDTDGDDSPVTMYIFLNAGRELDTLHNFLLATVAVSIIGTLLVFLLVVILSKIVVRPVAESYEKQKRFITDASHEIKTPLAIIGANIEVVEMENGESEWTKSIRNQITRLASLTEKLVFLSRMDEEGTSLVMEELDLSELVTESAEGFMGSAKSSGRTLTLAVAPHLTIRGERATLTQLVGLLLDNAMKYASAGSEITLSLEAHRKGKHTIRMIQTNACDHLKKGNLDILFERFYRPDASRNKETGGHGIGLSVAASIVRAHGGSIHADSPNGKEIRFTVLL